MTTGLMGLGTIGTPIAHRLFKEYKGDFFLVADEDRKKKLLQSPIYINDELFSANIFSDYDQPSLVSDILIICVKNYSLKASIRNLKPFIGEETIILPLQNGIFAYDFFRKYFPNNIVLQGFVQGPNTVKILGGFKYRNPGELHIGSELWPDAAKKVGRHLCAAGIPAYYEDSIKKMVWKKWMLNVAGNSVTALTGADYSLFKLHLDLQKICRNAMEEFLQVANAEGVGLTSKDVGDVIEYYVTYVGSKKTSMLMDVLNERKTENDYLAGTAIEVAERHGLTLPIISSLYYLMEVKEEVYMEKKGIRTIKKLFTEGVDYSDALRVQMNDVSRKMEDKEYARVISRGEMPIGKYRFLRLAERSNKDY